MHSVIICMYIVCHVCVPFVYHVHVYSAYHIRVYSATITCVFLSCICVFCYMYMCILVSADHPTILGFDPLVNQRLLPPTFPRYTKIKSRLEALEYFEELLTRLKVVCKITSHTSFHSALVSLQ